MELLKKREFESALALLFAMKETWPSDAVFKVSAVTDEGSADSSIEEDFSFLAANLLRYLQLIFLG